MSIGSVIERGQSVIVYDEKGKQLAMVLLGGGKLTGYTSSSFGIHRGGTLYTYDEKGRVKSTVAIGLAKS